MSGFHFRDLRIRRMAGVDEGFELRGLACGVNIVYGPNASGKTTTARAMEALLWPRVGDMASVSVEGVGEIGGDRWWIQVDAGSVQHQKDGVPAQAPPTAPAENRDRYRLWLPDLLRADDVDFAKRILIESSGGFDLKEAAKVLDRRNPTHRQRPEQMELRRARQRIRDALGVQEKLVAERAVLAEKEGRLARAAEVERTVSLYRGAVDHAVRREESAVARGAVEAFPEKLSRIRGDEGEQVAQLRERLREARAKHGAAEVARGRAERDLSRLGLPAAAAEGDLLFQLQANVDRLMEVDREISQHERDLKEAGERLEQEGAPLHGVVEPGKLAALGLGGLERLRDVVEGAEEVAAARRAILAEIAALPDESTEDDIDRLRHGAFLLEQWLSAGRGGEDESKYLRALLISALAVVAFAGLALAWAGSYLPAAAVILCGVLLAVAFRRVPRRVDEQPDREREYLRLGLIEAPDLWDAESVIQCLRKLEDRIERGTRAERARERRRELGGRLREAEERVPVAGERMLEVAADLGIELPADGVRLFWLVERISRWQRARIDRQAAEARLVEACGEQRALLEEANQRMEPVGLARITETRSLKGMVEKLRADVLEHERVTRVRTEAEDRLAHAAEEMARLDLEITGILSRAGLDSEDEHVLSELCLHAEEYRRSVRAYEIAEGQRASAERSLRALPGFEERLLSLPRGAAESLLTAADADLADLRQLGQEVGSLRNRIETAMAGHELEDAIEEEAMRSQALRDRRRRELREGIGALLVDYVERETRSEHLPDVFHRANQLFNRITHGAYELRVEVGDPPSFRAYDSRLDRGVALDELSSGTRVQLLFAVRVAFVECLEAGTSLPILMDETLANSDDERAAAIMDAVIQLAADGRQIFYFTAQPDEVAKWTRALRQQPEVPYARFDLAEIRGLEHRLEFDPAEIVDAASSVPVPAGLDHREYGRRLRVPRISLHAPPTAVHLWYLVEETDLLHHILANLRVSSWGELRSLMTTGGPRLLEVDSYDRIETAAELTEDAIGRIRVGRGRPVDRRALAASGAVSDRFIDEVDALCRQHEGDARLIVEQLEARVVPKFQTRSIEALREFLEGEGYLDTREPLNVEIVRRQIIAERSARSMSGALTLAEIDRLLARVAMGAGFPLQPRKQVVTHQPALWPEAPM